MKCKADVSVACVITSPVVAGADVHTDSDLRSLTREDLRDLFPGVGALKRRRTIFEIIHKRVSRRVETCRSD